MMKQEFVNKVNELGGSETYESIPAEDYRVIEYVYMYHPSVNGKEDIARIWMLPGGMRIIRDMVATAEKAEAIEKEERKITSQMCELRKQLEELKRQRQSL